MSDGNSWLGWGWGKRYFAVSERPGRASVGMIGSGRHKVGEVAPGDGSSGQVGISSTSRAAGFGGWIPMA